MTRIKIDTNKVIYHWYCPKCGERYEDKINTYGGEGWGTCCKNRCVNRNGNYQELKYSHTEIEIDKELAEFIYKSIDELKERLKQIIQEEFINS